MDNSNLFNFTNNRFNRIEAAIALSVVGFLAYWAGKGYYQNQKERIA